MKRYLIFSLLAFLVHGLVAQETRLTLDTCFALAKANNTKLKMDQLEIEKSREVKAQVFTKYFPQVTLSGLGYYAYKPLVQYGVNDINDESNFGQFVVSVIQDLQASGSDIPNEVHAMKEGWSSAATAMVPVYAGGRIANGNRLASLGVEASQLKSEVSERDLLEDIESSYYLLLGLQDKVETLRSALVLIDSLDRTVDLAIQAGVITNSDKLRVALKRNELQALDLQLNNGISLASLLLCHQIGIDYPEDGLTLEHDLGHGPEIPTLASGFNRPEKRLLELQIEAEKLYKKLTIGETLPQVGVGVLASYGNITDHLKFNAVLVANVSVPLTQWWETAHKMKEHDLKIKEAELMQKDLGGMMDLQERQAYHQMIEAESLLVSDSAALSMAEENYRLAELNYSAGMTTIADVLESHALLLQARNAITDRQITLASARRRYHDLTGQ